jgi:general secretion pathway protein F
MPIYEYKGMDRSGKSVKGILDADSKADLRQILQSRGIFVTDVHEGERSRGSGLSREVDFKGFFERVSLRDTAVLTRQLATLVRAGIPLVEALNALTDQAEKEEFKRILSDVRRQVNEGTSLAAALSKHDKVFTPLYINMVKAGESSGNLDTVLDRLTDFLDNQIEMRGKIFGAMAYPAFMILVGVAAVMWLFTFVIPKITQIFEDQDKALPFITQIFIGLSDFMAGWWFVILPVIVAIGAGFNYWRTSEDGKPIWDRFLLQVPGVGDLVRKIAVARFARTLGTLLASGVPLLEALRIVKNVLGNTRLIEVIEEARLNIREGESIAQPLKRSGEFPPMVVHMISIGEKSGQLEEMLENIAIAYNQQVDLRIQTLTTLLEPLLILLMAVGVGFVVFSVMLPILQMNQFVG